VEIHDEPKAAKPQLLMIPFGVLRLTEWDKCLGDEGLFIILKHSSFSCFLLQLFKSQALNGLRNNKVTFGLIL
jgi:hypothetical protein